MNPVGIIKQEIGKDWLPDFYVSHIRAQRTRSFEMDIPERENRADIMETLLGYELKVGKLRVACPDIGIARYLRVFAILGCRKVAVPYDITVVPHIADRLDEMWAETVRKIEAHGHNASPQQKGRIRASVIRVIRKEVYLAGAGELMPLFNKPTKQRNS